MCFNCFSISESNVAFVLWVCSILKLLILFIQILRKQQRLHIHIRISKCFYHSSSSTTRVVYKPIKDV